MGGPVIMSALFHGVALALLYLGLPHLKYDELSGERVVVVELFTVDERRNLPEHSSELEAKKELREEDRAPGIDPPPAPPPPSSRNSIRTVSTPPPPKPAPLPLDEELQKQVEGVGLVDDVEVPIKKPNPPSKPDPFASVLKSVEELEVSRVARSEHEPEPEPEESKPALPTKDPFEEILARADSKFTPDAPLSMTELDNIRYQIQKNWHLPAGGRNVQNMQVTLRIQLGPDGTVLDVSVVDQVQMKTDPFYRAMAESTVRAVLKTDQIKNLSPEKYHLWRDMKINFDPREMFG